MFDFFEVGYKDTLEVIEEAGLQHFGTVYPTRKDGGYDDLLTVDVKDIRIGFVGFTYPQDSDVKLIKNRINKLKKEMGCDIVVVSLHWGREGAMTPQSSQITYAKKVIDAGADIIWGQHPHVIQPIQFIDNKPVMYSTGNFVFGSISAKLDTSTGIFQVTMEKIDGVVQIKQFKVIPCTTQRAPDYRTYELTDQAARETLFGKLVLKKKYSGCENPPAGFLTTGIVEFQNGQMVK